MKKDINKENVFDKEKNDKDLINTIDLILYQYFDKVFCMEQDCNFTPDYVDSTYYNLLRDKDSIIDELINNNYDTCYFGNTYIKNTKKLWQLLDTEYLKQLDRCKKYYDRRLRTRNKIKDKELKDDLMQYFEYCFKESKNSTDDKLYLMQGSNFRKATIEDLDINTRNYTDFNKIYNEALRDFKRIHKNDVEEEQQEGIGFGWKLYGVVKAIECLFKL